MNRFHVVHCVTTLFLLSGTGGGGVYVFICLCFSLDDGEKIYIPENVRCLINANNYVSFIVTFQHQLKQTERRLARLAKRQNTEKRQTVCCCCLLTRKKQQKIVLGECMMVGWLVVYGIIIHD